jgi:hypothetical protein
VRAQQRASCELEHGIRELARVRSSEQPAHTVLDQRQRSARRDRDHRQPARLRLEDHLPERVRGAREQEDVGAPIRARELGPLVEPAEERRRASQPIAKAPLLGTAAGEREVQAGLASSRQLERVGQQIGPLLLRDAPAVEDPRRPRGPRRLRRPAQGRGEARGVHAPVPPQDPLERHADRRERLVGGRARGEDQVAGSVEGTYGYRHRVGDALLARAQAGVGGQLGVVAADQRQSQRSPDERAGDARRTGRAHVDHVEAPVGDRVHGRRQAGNADPQTGVEGHLDLRDGRQPPVYLGVGSEHLDVESRHAALADLFDRAGHTMGRADAIGQDRHARTLALVAAAGPTPAGERAGVGDRGKLRLLIGEEGSRRRVGDGGYAGLEQTLGGHGQLGLPRGGADRHVDGLAELVLVGATGAPVEVGVAEVLLLHVRDQLARVTVLEPDRAQPLAQQAARVLGGEVASGGPLPRVALEQHAARHRHHAPRIGARVALRVRARPERTGRERDRRMRPLGGASLGAARQHLAAADVREKLLGRVRVRRFGVRAADVDAGVVVAAADPDAVARRDVRRRGPVQLLGSGPVADLPDGEQLGQAPAVARPQRRAYGVVGVGEGAGDLPLVQVCRAQLDVAGVGDQPFVVLRSDPVAEHVHGLGLAPEVGGQLLGDEHVGPVRDLQHAGDRVVVGDRHEVHAAPPGQLVHLLRRSCALRQPDGPLNAEARKLRSARVAVHVDPRGLGRHALSCHSLTAHVHTVPRKVRIFVINRERSCERLVKPDHPSTPNAPCAAPATRRVRASP